MNSLRLILLLSIVLAVAKAFTPLPALTPRPRALLELEACRTNAKKEKIKRNRENMRKFKTGGGRKGLSRRKILKKTLSSRARAAEAEFITKCFITSAGAANDGGDKSESKQ